MDLETLLQELQENLACLRADVRVLDDPTARDAPFAEGYRVKAYEAVCAGGFLRELDEETEELLHAFYRSLRVMGEGHPGLLEAEPGGLEQAYRITVEAAIALGEQLLERLEGG